MVTWNTEVELENTSVEKDIGGHIDSKLNFDSHILSVVKKANRRMGVIRRSFKTLDKDIIPLLFKVIARPHLQGSYAFCLCFIFPACVTEIYNIFPDHLTL